MVFLPCGRALAMAPGCEKRNTPPEGGVGTPQLARLEPYRPRCRAGVGTLAASHQVAGRFAGPEPSAPLWILLLTHNKERCYLGQSLDRSCGGRSLTIPCSIKGGVAVLPIIPSA